MMQEILAHHPEWATGSAWGDFRGSLGMFGMMGPGMMGWWGGPQMMGGWPSGFWIWQILGWITWILVIAALVAFIRWMWKKGDREK